MFNDWILKPLCALLGIELYEDEQITKYKLIIASASVLENNNLQENSLSRCSSTMTFKDSRGNTRNLCWIQSDLSQKTRVSLVEIGTTNRELYFQENFVLEDIVSSMQKDIEDSVKEILARLYVDPDSINGDHIDFLKFAQAYAEKNPETCKNLNDELKAYQPSLFNTNVCNGQELRWAVANEKLTAFKDKQGKFDEKCEAQKTSLSSPDETKTEQAQDSEGNVPTSTVNTSEKEAIEKERESILAEARLIAREVNYLLRLEGNGNEELQNVRQFAVQFVVTNSLLFTDELNTYALKLYLLVTNGREENDTLASWEIAAKLVSFEEESAQDNSNSIVNLPDCAARYINYLNLKRRGIFNEEVRKKAAIHSFNPATATNPRERYLAALELVNQTKREKSIWVKNTSGQEQNYSDLAARYIWETLSAIKFKKPDGLEAAVLRTVLLSAKSAKNDGEISPKQVARRITSNPDHYKEDQTLLKIAIRYNELFPGRGKEKI